MDTTANSASLVARASRPCESCSRHTGETPVPLPSENQLTHEWPNNYPIEEREFLQAEGRCRDASVWPGTGSSAPAVIPKRAGGAVFEVLAAMPERSQQHAQMLLQRIEMGLARGGHERVPVQNDYHLVPFERQLLQPLAEIK